MIARALLLGVFFVIGAQCQFGEFDSPFSHSQWNWRSPDLFGAESRKAVGSEREIEDVTEKDREALAPDYTDPTRRPKDDVVKPTIRPDHSSYNPGVIPGGVVDVDADDFGFSSGFPQIPDTFGFASSFGNRNPGSIFGLGGFFGPVAEQKPWWKGTSCAELLEDPKICNFIDEFHKVPHNRNVKVQNELFREIIPEVVEIISEFETRFRDSEDASPESEESFPQFPDIDKDFPAFNSLFPEFEDSFPQGRFPQFHNKFPDDEEDFSTFDALFPEFEDSFPQLHARDSNDVFEHFDKLFPEFEDSFPQGRFPHFHKTFPDVEDFSAFDTLFPEFEDSFPQLHATPRDFNDASNNFDKLFPGFDNTFDETFPDSNEIFKKVDMLFPKPNKKKIPGNQEKFPKVHKTFPELPLDDQK